MKKLTLAAISVASLFVGSASAVDFDLSGNVATVCTVSSATTAITSLAGGTISGINMSCNDFDGATVTMTSSEGGLQGIDSEDLVIPYKATLTPVGLTPLVLNMMSNGTTGNNDTSVSTTYSGSSLLNGTSAELVITTGSSTSTGTWAGAYYDKLTIQISAL